jgi:hypothetical protein
MTIRSIAAGARARTAASTTPGAPVVVTTAAAGPGGTSAPAGADTLLGWVPTDVVVLYTTVLGVLVGIVADEPLSTYLPMRWVLYGGCIAATGLAVLLAYYLQPVPDPGPQKPPGMQTPVAETLPPADQRRRVPVAETVAAVLAFGIWGLVIPGSPLYVVLDPPTLPVVVTTLSAVGVFLITVVFGPWLGRPASGRKTP